MTTMSSQHIEFDVILTDIRAALAENDPVNAAAILNTLRHQDQADIFADLLPIEQDMLLPHLNPEDSADILEELVEEEAAEIASRLDTDQLVPILDSMEPDEAADLLGDITPEQANELLSEMTEAENVISLLEHEDESAGGMMTAAEVTLQANMTVAEAVENLRKVPPDSEEVFYLFVLDEWTRIVGVVSVRQLAIAQHETKIKDIMDPDVIYVEVDADQEEAARIMAHYNLLALPVVDAEKHLLGLITYDDSFDVLEEEATEDIYRLGGVLEGQPADVPIPDAMRNRLPWLVLNMGTAMASALVLSLFENTIAQIAALAAFFPIVAGVSGSAGTQTLTVTVRGIALGEIQPADGLRALRRELLIGLVNGIVLGSTVAVIALLWKKTPLLGLVVGIATLLNMITAGIAGVLVPLGLTR